METVIYSGLPLLAAGLYLYKILHTGSSPSATSVCVEHHIDFYRSENSQRHARQSPPALGQHQAVKTPLISPNAPFNSRGLTDHSPGSGSAGLASQQGRLSVSPDTPVLPCKSWASAEREDHDLRAQLDSVSAKLATAERHRTRAEMDAKRLLRTAEGLEKRLRAAEQQQRVAKEESARMQAEYAEALQQQQDLRDSNVSAVQAAEQVQAEVERLAGQLAAERQSFARAVQEEHERQLAALHRDLHLQRSESQVARAGLEELASKRTSLEQQLAAVQQQLAATTASLTTSEACRAASDEALGQRQDQVQVLTKEKADLDRQLEQLRGRLAEASQQSVFLEQRLHEAHAKLEAKQHALDQASQQQEQQLEAQQHDLDQALLQMAAQQQQLEATQHDLDRASERIAAQQQQLGALTENQEAGAAAAKAERERLRQELQALKAAASSADCQITQLKSEVEEEQEERGRLEASLAAAAEEVERLEEQQQDDTRRQAAAQQQVQELRASLGQAEERSRFVQAQVEQAHQDAATCQRSLQAVINGLREQLKELTAERDRLAQDLQSAFQDVRRRSNDAFCAPTQRSSQQSPSASSGSSSPATAREAHLEQQVAALQQDKLKLTEALSFALQSVQLHPGRQASSLAMTSGLLLHPASTAVRRNTAEPQGTAAPISLWGRPSADGMASPSSGVSRSLWGQAGSTSPISQANLTSAGSAGLALDQAVTHPPLVRSASIGFGEAAALAWKSQVPVEDEPQPLVLRSTSVALGEVHTLALRRAAQTDVPSQAERLRSRLYENEMRALRQTSTPGSLHPQFLLGVSAGGSPSSPGAQDGGSLANRELTLARQQIKHLQSELAHLARAKKAQDQRLTSVLTECEAARTELGNALQAKERVQMELQYMMADLEDSTVKSDEQTQQREAMDAKLKAAMESEARLQARLASMTQDMQSQAAQLQAAQDSQRQLTAELSALQKQLTEPATPAAVVVEAQDAQLLMETRAKHEAEMAELQEKLCHALRARNQMSDGWAGAIEERDSLQEQVTAAEQEVKRLQAQLANSSTAGGAASSPGRPPSEATADVSSQPTSPESAPGLTPADLHRLEGELAAVQADRDGLRTEVTAGLDKLKGLHSKMAALQQEADRLRAERDAAQQELEHMQGIARAALHANTDPALSSRLAAARSDPDPDRRSQSSPASPTRSPLIRHAHSPRNEQLMKQMAQSASEQHEQPSQPLSRQLPDNGAPPSPLENNKILPARKGTPSAAKGIKQHDLNTLQAHASDARDPAKPSAPAAVSNAAAQDKELPPAIRSSSCSAHAESESADSSPMPLAGTDQRDAAALQVPDELAPDPERAQSKPSMSGAH